LQITTKLSVKREKNNTKYQTKFYVAYIFVVVKPQSAEITNSKSGSATSRHCDFHRI